MVLRIRAGNQLDQPRTVTVRSNLPAGVRPAHILNLGGLQLGYDVQNDVYYVHKQVELGPKEIALYEVELKDIWTIPAEELEKIGARAQSLAALLERSADSQDTARALRQEIEKNLAQIVDRQARSAIQAGVTPVEHIGAYEANRRLLEVVKRDLGRLENLALALGNNPGELIGDVQPVKPFRPELPPDQYGEVVFRITVRNTSPTEKRKIPLRRDLPPEIGPLDVLEKGGLEVGVDEKTGRTYVHAKEVELDPGGVVTFNVRLRDRWDTNAPRFQALRQKAEDFRARLRDKEQFASIDQALAQIVRDLDAIASEPRPNAVDDQYIAFFRRQTERVNEVEQRLHRIESALRMVEARKLGVGSVKPPSAKTTWLIIYIVLGFLALISLLFFLRWYVRGEARETPVMPPASEK
ncbi:MAG: hypothetical protein ACUVWX_00475 [Kiritimatiellia bacterium]